MSTHNIMFSWKNKKNIMCIPHHIWSYGYPFEELIGQMAHSTGSRPALFVIQPELFRYIAMCLLAFSY